MRLGKGWLARRRLQLTVAAVVAATAAAIGIGSSGSAVGALSDDSVGNLFRFPIIREINAAHGKLVIRQLKRLGERRNGEER